MERRSIDRRLDDHRIDQYAHNESWAGQRKPYVDQQDANIMALLVGKDGDGGVMHRLTDLEKFQERATGGMIVLGSMVGGGILVVIAHLLRLI